MEPPDSAFASHATLDAWYRWRGPETWSPVAAATLRSQTHLSAQGRLAWQLPLAELGEQLEWMATKGTDYSAIRVPVPAIWTDMLEPASRAMMAAGHSAADLAMFRRWVVETGLMVKQSGLASLHQSSAPVTVVELEAPHLVHWYDPVRVISETNRFLSHLGSPS